MSSKNNLPFEWVSDYEKTVKTLTNGWSDSVDGGAQKLVHGREHVQSPSDIAIAKAGYMNYYSLLKAKLGALGHALRHRHDVAEELKTSVAEWYQNLETVSLDKYGFSRGTTLGSIRREFVSAFKHLVMKGNHFIQKTTDPLMKTKVGIFMKSMADKLIVIIKDIVKRIKQIPKDLGL